MIATERDGRMSATGYVKVGNTEVSCMLTRFNVRSFWWLMAFYMHYRRIRRDARKIDGLLATAFLLEDLHTCYTLSLWRSEAAILEFNSVVLAHVRAANSAFRGIKRTAEGPQLWSAQFKLWALSPFNLRWEGVRLEPERGTEIGDENAWPTHTA